MGNKEKAEELYELVDMAICRMIGVLEVGFEDSANTDTIPTHLCWYLETLLHFGEEAKDLLTEYRDEVMKTEESEESRP